MTDLHELYCLNLVKLRNINGYTQLQMADKLKLEVRSYQRIENGYKKGECWPDHARIRQLAKILKCDTLDFFKPVKKN